MHCFNNVLIVTGFGQTMAFFKMFGRLKRPTEVMKNGFITSHDLNCAKNSYAFLDDLSGLRK